MQRQNETQAYKPMSVGWAVKLKKNRIFKHWNATLIAILMPFFHALEYLFVNCINQ